MMKVLWILNSPLPEALALLTGIPQSSRTTGSWVCALAEALGGEEDIELHTAAPSSRVRRLTRLKGISTTHHLFPADAPCWGDLLAELVPDVVHIHGTEYPFFLDCVNACGNTPVIVSLQGMVSTIRDSYFGGIPEQVIRKNISLRDRVRHDSLLTQHEDVCRRGDAEISLLRSVRHVIGRTAWDRAQSLSIAPGIQYHHCDELLRAPFYTGTWTFENCRPHRIFVSQGHYPLKGVHTLFEALPAVLKRFPDTEVRIAGVNVLRGNGLKEKLLRSGYGQYLADLIQKNNLDEAVEFIGESDAERMKREYLSTNVYALVSAIENSPNSLCEAQMLGVPCIAADTGGTSSLVPDPSCGRLYPYADTSALTETILAAFEDSPTFINTRMRQVAADRHDRQAILRNLKTIYDEVAG